MKKINGLILLIALLALGLVACNTPDAVVPDVETDTEVVVESDDSAETDSATADPAIVAANEITRYKNVLSGLSISHPRDWLKEDRVDIFILGTERGNLDGLNSGEQGISVIVVVNNVTDMGFSDDLDLTDPVAMLNEVIGPEPDGLGIPETDIIDPVTATKVNGQLAATVRHVAFLDDGVPIDDFVGIIINGNRVAMVFSENSHVGTPEVDAEIIAIFKSIVLSPASLNP